MRVYICRHGEAGGVDARGERALTPRGREAVCAMARAIAPAAAVRVREVRHSPKLRARETAQLLVRELGLEVPVREVAGLAPEDDVHALRAQLLAERTDVLLVSHLPLVARLTALLVTGRDELAAGFRFEPATLAYLGAGAGSERFELRWLLTPSLFGLGGG